MIVADLLIRPSTMSATSAPIASMTFPNRGRVPWKSDSATARPECPVRVRRSQRQSGISANPVS